MRISTKGSYAMEAMLAIASHDDDRAVSIREISERTGISDKYLEQIFLLLKEAGLLRGTRGVGGGYVLSKTAEEITVGDILRATETSFSPVPCLNEDDACNMMPICATREVWIGLDATIRATTDHMTLRDLLVAFRTDSSKALDNYSI